MRLVTDQDYSVAEAAGNPEVNANLPGRWKKASEQPENESTSPGSMAAMQFEEINPPEMKLITDLFPYNL